MLSAAALTIRDLAYWYVRGAPVLDNADLTVAPGEVVMVRGPNASGKTTLLRLLRASRPRGAVPCAGRLPSATSRRPGRNRRHGCRPPRGSRPSADAP